MKIILRTLLRKSTGDIVARDSQVTGSPIRLGRSADSEVFLNDPRTLLQQAEIHERDGGLFIESVGNGRIIIRGDSVSSSQLKIGDQFQIGPYEFKLEAVPSGGDADYLLSVELVHELEDVQSALSGRSTLSLEDLGLRAKPWSIGLGVLILALFIVLPLTEHFSGEAKRVALEQDGPRTVKEIRDGIKEDSGILPVSMRQFWQAGHLSSSHKIFGLDCSACHQEPFQQVARETCANCHADAHDHVDVEKFPNANMSNEACSTCHKEHEGSQGLKIASEQFCSDCHGNITTVAGDGSELYNIASFDDHKPFWYEEVGAKPSTGIKFSHKQHLDKEGMRVPDGERGERRVLGCDSCHQTDATGTVMQKPEFEKVCADCHSLAFDANAPDREIPHADVATVKQYIRDAYSSIALRGGYKPAKGESVPTVVRRIPGSQQPTEKGKREALAWADAKADEVIAGHFGKKRCGECHEIVENGTNPLNWTIVEVKHNDLYLDKGHFNHKPHDSVSCAECHGAEQSEQASDLILPTIETCKDCHGSGNSVSLITTTCTTCHGFHNKDETEVKQ